MNISAQVFIWKTLELPEGDTHALSTGGGEVNETEAQTGFLGTQLPPMRHRGPPSRVGSQLQFVSPTEWQGSHKRQPP